MAVTADRGRTAPGGAGPPARTSPVLVWAALGTVYVVWGSTYLGIKVSIETLPPLVSTAVRFGTASLILLAAVAVLRPRSLRVRPVEVGTAAAAGLLLLLGGNGAVVLAEERLSSGLAALLISTTPLWIVVLRALTGDRPSVLTVVGISTGFAGVAVLLLGAGEGEGSPLAEGDVGRGVLVVGAALSWACGSLLAVRRPMPANPFVGSTIEMAVGALALGTVGVLRGELRGFALEQVSGRSWFALAYLVTAGSLVAFSAYVWVLDKAPVSLVSTYAYVNPAIAVVLGVVLLDERVGPAVLAGGAVIVAAVALVVTAEGRVRRARPVAPPDGTSSAP